MSIQPMPLAVHRFWTEYAPDPADAAQLREIDWVEYAPLGSSDRSRTIERVSRLGKLNPLAPDNPASVYAHARWATIGPMYQAWKDGRTLTVDGTPLAAWAGVSPEQAEALTMRSVVTVEQLAELTDTHIQRLGIPNLRSIIQAAKRYLESRDGVRVAAELAKRDEQIEDLKAELAELTAMIRGNDAPAKRGPGRPRKAADEAEAA